MHHLSILVSVCMRIKECRILDVAVGDGEAVNSWRDLVPAQVAHWKVYCGCITLAESKRDSHGSMSDDNNLKIFSSPSKMSIKVYIKKIQTETAVKSSI